MDGHGGNDDDVSQCYMLMCGHNVSGDLTGQVLAYISLLPIAILVGFVTLIVFKRELHTVSRSMSLTSDLFVVTVTSLYLAFLFWLIIPCMESEDRYLLYTL